MERIVRPQLKSQPEAIRRGADMPTPVARGRTVSETLDSAETIVRPLIASAGFAFDPLVVLA